MICMNVMMNARVRASRMIMTRVDSVYLAFCRGYEAMKRVSKIAVQNHHCDPA